MRIIFLQFTDSSDSFYENPVMILLILALSFLISAIITRAVLSIPAFLKHQKMQTILLMKIAKAQGVSDEEIKIISEILEPETGKFSPVTDKSILQINDLHLKKAVNQSPETKLHP